MLVVDATTVLLNIHWKLFPGYSGNNSLTVTSVVSTITKYFG